MTEWHGQHDGPMTIDRDLELRGHVGGRVTVLGGVTLILRGLIDDDLIIERGAAAEVHGTVNGAVVNVGGDVAIFGTVGSVTGTHLSRIDPAAVVIA